MCNKLGTKKRKYLPIGALLTSVQSSKSKTYYENLVAARFGVIDKLSFNQMAFYSFSKKATLLKKLDKFVEIVE